VRRVVDVVETQVRIELGSAPVPADAERIAIVVQFSTDPAVSRSFPTLIAELTSAGYHCIVASACEAPGDLSWPWGRPDALTVLRKPNIGYDFGSAAVALHRFPDVLAAPYVLVVNDSNVGPFRSLRPCIEAFEKSEADVWGLTGSNQHTYHLQSFFLGFRRGVLAEPVLRRFWRNIHHHEEKSSVIERYELGLSHLLESEGYILDHEYGAARVGAPSDRHPAIWLWRELLANGYPFVKRELLTKASLDVSRVGVSNTLRAMFNVEVDDWV
jgi:hypothetical protein